MRGLGGGDEEDSRKWLGRLSEASEIIWVLSSGPASASQQSLPTCFLSTSLRLNWLPPSPALSRGLQGLHSEEGGERLEL